MALSKKAGGAVKTSREGSATASRLATRSAGRSQARPDSALLGREISHEPVLPGQDDDGDGDEEEVEVGEWDEAAFTGGGGTEEAVTLEGGLEISAASPAMLLSPFSTTFSPHLARLSRQPSLAAASSDSELTYADIPSDARDVTAQFALAVRNQDAATTSRSPAARTSRTRAAFTDQSAAPVPRAAAPFFAPSSGPAYGPLAPAAVAVAGLPPSAFSLPAPPSTAGHHRPFAPTPPRRALRPTRSGTADQPAVVQQKQQQQRPTQASLLDAFLAADRAVKENRPLKRTRSRVEEWRDEVAEEEASAAVSHFEEEQVGQEDQQERIPSSDEEAGSVQGGSEEDLVDLQDAGQKKAPSRRQPRGSFSPPSASPSASSPAVSSENRRKSTTNKGVAKKARVDAASSSASSQEARKKRRLTTKDTVAMLPARRRMIRVREDTEDEDDEASEAETDYELFSSPRHRRPSKRVRASSGKTVYGAKKKVVKGRRGRKRSDEEEEEDSEDKERKEATRRKWAEVDNFPLETELAL